MILALEKNSILKHVGKKNHHLRFLAERKWDQQKVFGTFLLSIQKVVAKLYKRYKAAKCGQRIVRFSKSFLLQMIDSYMHQKQTFQEHEFSVNKW